VKKETRTKRKGNPNIFHKLRNCFTSRSIRSLATRHKILIPQLLADLKQLGREDILVIAGGVIPAQDYDFLYDAGVAGVYGPGTVIAGAAQQILRKLEEQARPPDRLSLVALDIGG
jgi:methylmalonyl-CoA mutase cobalamin-binding domain/chain